MAIEIVSFRSYEKNTLRGFLTLRLSTIGLEIRDATVHAKGGKAWIGLPAKPYQDENGETKYSYVVKFTEKSVWEKFQSETLEALKEYQSQKKRTPTDDAF